MRVDINLKKEIDDSYSIYIGELPKIDLRGKKVAIVTNPKVAGLHLAKLLKSLEADEVYLITVPDGEEFKNMESVDYILKNLFNHKFNRKSILIGFGGGVIGDMVGFSASLYQRGLDFIQIPTTLLSQVDASVGGKTGVNNSYGKNLIGAFHQPKAVYIDTKFLETLPKREFGAGFAELVKMAVIFDKDFLYWLKENDLRDGHENLEYAIKRSVELKADVVSKDEKESGLRASLNYGHTFGHVIENETGYSQFLHGEAVAIGMIMANRLSHKLGMMSINEFELVKEILRQYDLPVDYQIDNLEKFYNKFSLDKKATNSSVRFIIPKGLGDFEFKDNLSKDILMEVLKDFSH